MPDRNLKVALLPIDIKCGDNAYQNMQQVIAKLNFLEKDCDLVVLPEMFNTGFIPDKNKALPLAETNDGKTISQLKDLASQLGIAFWGSFMATDADNNLVNRGFMIDSLPDNDILFYDKRHLFSYGGESELFAKGTGLSPIVNFRSWRLKMSICYDIRFPLWNRAIKNNFDALIVPANWPHSRAYAWRQLLIARAIENQCYVAGCNREGNDPYGAYRQGESWIFNELGKEISYSDDNSIIYGIFDAASFNKSRERFTPWCDADNFTLTID